MELIARLTFSRWASAPTISIVGSVAVELAEQVAGVVWPRHAGSGDGHVEQRGPRVGMRSSFYVSATQEEGIMCQQCWEEEGSPKIDTPMVRATAKAIDDVYEFSCVGGNLHIAIDDYNLDDGNLDFCLESINENVHEGDEEQLAAERYALYMLRQLTEEERYSAVALRHKEWISSAAS